MSGRERARQRRSGPPLLISWRRDYVGAEGCCLPVALLNTCIVLVSIPPTFCFGALFAFGATARRSKRFQAATKAASEGCGAAGVWQALRRRFSAKPSGRAARTLSLKQERQLWRRAMISFFRGRAELHDLGPVIWQFLNDQPEALRIATLDGRVRDLPLRSLVAPAKPLMDARGEVLGLLPRGVVCAVGSALAVAELETGAEPVRLLEGHTGDVTCFSKSREILATGSADTTVRLWKGTTCIRVCASQEWSEWTGTIYMGHVSAVTAVCLARVARSEAWACDDLRLASGDLFGAVAVWRTESCAMLYPAHHSPVTCMASEDGAPTFVVGHQDGTVVLASWDDFQVRNTWQGQGEPILAARPVGYAGEVIAASPRALLHAKPGEGELEKIAAFPRPAAAARFEGDSLLLYGRAFVAVLSLDGSVRVMLDVGGADVCAASLVLPRARPDKESEAPCGAEEDEQEEPSPAAAAAA